MGGFDPRLLLLTGLVAAGCSSAPLSTPSIAATPGSSPSALDPAEALENTFVSVVERVSPSVVQIQGPQGLGSGIVLDAQGDIVTNAHVVAGASRFTVTFWDGTTASARLLDAYAPNDVAVIQLEGEVKTLSPATFADSSKLRVGDVVLAIGNPLGLRSSVTDGIISGFRSGVPESNGEVLPSVIQTSAAINPGNSGGALVDLHGEVVGIPTLAATDPQLGSTAPGIGFAIPSNTVKDLASQIVQYGRVVDSHRAYLGVQVGNAAGEGAVITGLAADGPAARAGLAQGDLITSVGGQKIQTPEDLTAALAGLEPGATVRVEVTHPDGSSATVPTTLGSYPAG